ncbi:MAG: DUF1653 domain-containing protein [Candidatus Campbellbacteria bacterium]|nr:DUF1653 domain-containing protein [Candidatus Campbellbacteria bacterium]
MSLKTFSRVPEPGFYYHQKHDPQESINNYAYEVTGIGFHTENDRMFLVYRPLYESPAYKASKEFGVPCFYIRPLEMWLETAKESGEIVLLFQKITDPITTAELARIRQEMYP